jgi:hypothetical protein
LFGLKKPVPRPGPAASLSPAKGNRPKALAGPDDFSLLQKMPDLPFGDAAPPRGRL